jgi:type VI protein secretion system component VasK
MTLELNILITIFTAITLGVLSWMAWKVQEMSATVATIETSLKYGEEKFVNHERDLLELRARITACEIALAQFKITLGNKNHRPSSAG